MLSILSFLLRLYSKAFTSDICVIVNNYCYLIFLLLFRSFSFYVLSEWVFIHAVSKIIY
jgi:hypothetical protein